MVATSEAAPARTRAGTRRAAGRAGGRRGTAGAATHPAAGAHGRAAARRAAAHAAACRDEHAADGVGVAAQLAGVAHADVVALAALDGRRRLEAADGHGDGVLHVHDAEAVARGGLAVDLDLEVRLADDALGIDRRGVDGRHLAEQRLQRDGRLLQCLQVGPAHLDAHGRAHAGLQHDEARLDGLQLRRARRARHAAGAHDLVPDVLRRADVLAPLAIRPAAAVGHEFAIGVAEELAGAAVVREAHAPARRVRRVLGPVVDDGLEHRDGRRVQRALGAADLADDGLDLGDRLERRVLVRHHLQRLAHGRVRHERRHPEERALVQRRHELAAEAGERVHRPRVRAERADPRLVDADGETMARGTVPTTRSKPSQTLAPRSTMTAGMARNARRFASAQRSSRS
jgi:hypothetical protein